MIEALFFDVRWALDASGWVVCRVIIPETQADAFDLAAKLKLAYFGGPVMARSILDSQACLPTKAASRIFDREILLHLKFQEAMEAPLDERERLKYLELYLHYDISRRRLELDKERLAHQCAQDKHLGESESQSQETVAVEDEGENSVTGFGLESEHDDDERVVTDGLLKRLVA